MFNVKNKKNITGNLDTIFILQQNGASAVDCGIWSGSTLFVTYPADVRHINRK